MSLAGKQNNESKDSFVSSKVEIDFTTLKYNLYDILNVKPDVDDITIKKSFQKIIKTFHPDKNSDLEEDIYYHIILSNQILLNKDSRKKYDNYLMLEYAGTFSDLKKSFTKELENLSNSQPNFNVVNDKSDKSEKSYKQKNEELNKRHGFSDTSVESVMDRFNKVKGNRDINIEKEEIKNMTDFNSKFTNNKMENGKFNNQVVEYKGQPSELSTYVIGEQYTNLGDIDKLYIEDTVQCSKYSSLDRAFSLQPILKHEAGKTFEDRMKDYQSQTDVFKGMKTSEFSTKKFNEWT